MREFPGVIACRKSAEIHEVPDAGQFRTRFASSVDSRASAGAVTEFLVTPPHRAARVVQVVLEAVATAYASKRGFAVEAGRLQHLIPEAMPPRTIFPRIFVSVYARTEKPVAE